MLTQVCVWLNAMANGAGLLLSPIAWLPGWLSATLVAGVTGVLMLLAFKYTSNQEGIRRTRGQIKANLLALSLFRDNLPVSLWCQAKLFGNAVKLVGYSLVPMAVMTLPMVLLLGQLALWYQARPLRVGEEAIVTVELRPDDRETLQGLQLATSDGVRVVTGPVRVPAKHMVCWNIAPTSNGPHRLQFTAAGQSFDKQLVVWNGFHPTSLKRPGWQLGDVLLHPREAPFARQSPVQSIEVTYPHREAFTSGTNWWFWYWLLVSMLAALAVKPFFHLHI